MKCNIFHQLTVKMPLNGPFPFKTRIQIELEFSLSTSVRYPVVINLLANGP